MLHVLPEAHALADQGEVFLQVVPGGDGCCCGIGAQEVPGVEAGEVLEGSEEFVAADCVCAVLARGVGGV